MKNISMDDAFLFIRTPYRFFSAIKHNLTVPHDIGLNQTQMRTLLLLREQGPVSMHVLGSLTGIVKGSLTQVVDGLVEEKLAERKRDPGDRRSVLVSITGDGRRVTERLDKNLIEHTEEILKGFNATQKQELISALRTIHRSLELIEKREKNAAAEE